MINVDIIIISYSKTPDLKEVTEAGIKSLIQSETDILFHIIVVEQNKEVNFSLSKILKELGKTHKLHTLFNVHPNCPPDEFGYHKYANIGLKYGVNEYVCICNNDLTYENNWCSEIISAMKEIPDLLSASPFCPENQMLLHYIDKNLHYGYNIRQHLNGFCIFQQRKIYEIIGPLDERFKFWYCDNDYGMTLYKHKIDHALVTSSVVHHHSNRVGKTAESILNQEENHRLTTEQEHIFYKKWEGLWPAK